MTRWLSTAEVAEQIGLTAESVTRLCSIGDLPATKLGNRWRVHPDDLERYMQPSVKTSPRKRRTTARQRRRAS